MLDFICALLDFSKSTEENSKSIFWKFLLVLTIIFGVGIVHYLVFVRPIEQATILVANKTVAVATDIKEGIKKYMNKPEPTVDLEGKILNITTKKILGGIKSFNLEVSTQEIPIVVSFGYCFGSKTNSETLENNIKVGNKIKIHTLKENVANNGNAKICPDDISLLSLDVEK